MFRQPNRFPSTNSRPMTKPRKKPTKQTKLGDLPDWNLDDLYPGPDSRELKWDRENA